MGVTRQMVVEGRRIRSGLVDLNPRRVGACTMRSAPTLLKARQAACGVDDGIRPEATRAALD